MIAQTIIAVFGLAGVWLMNDKDNRYRRYGPILGLLAQPAWLYVAWQASQWGVFILAIAYTVAWGRGVWTMWIRP